MQIQILGSGCPTCKKLFELTKQAVLELDLKIEVEYITDIQKIVEMGILSGPALVINKRPILTGFLPSIKKLKEIIKKFS